MTKVFYRSLGFFISFFYSIKRILKLSRKIIFHGTNIIKETFGKPASGSGWFFLWDIARNSELARIGLMIWLAPRESKVNQIPRCDWLHKRASGRSGLPAVALLTKLVRLRWLVIFWRVYGPPSRSINSQKRTWPISSHLDLRLGHNPCILPAQVTNHTFDFCLQR